MEWWLISRILLALLCLEKPLTHWTNFCLYMSTYYGHFIKMELRIMWGIIFARILTQKNNILKYYTCSHVCRYANDSFTCWKILCYKYTTKSIYHLILIENFPFYGYYNYCYHKHSRINKYMVPLFLFVHMRMTRFKTLNCVLLGEPNTSLLRPWILLLHCLTLRSF